jgi:hypothetical protein
MKDLRELGQLDRINQRGDFVGLVKHLAISGGRPDEAAARARGHHASSRVVELLEKAAVTGAAPDSWGAQLAGYSTMVAAFVDALSQSSAFYRMLADGGLVRLPFAVRVGSIGTGASAAIVKPGMAIPVSQMTLANVELERRKAAGIVALSNELLADGGAAAEALISRSLRVAVGTAVDAAFVTTLLDGVSGSGATPNAMTDLRTALTAIGPTDGSRLYWIAAPDVGITLATAQASGPTAAMPLFPSVGATGGELLGLPLLVSSGVAAGSLLLIDASGIAAASDTVAVDVSPYAALQLDSTPTMSTGSGSPLRPVATTTVSGWATDTTTIRALAYFGCEKMRAGGVAAITGASAAW